jgi:hypothetical protein
MFPSSFARTASARSLGSRPTKVHLVRSLTAGVRLPTTRRADQGRIFGTRWVGESDAGLTSAVRSHTLIDESPIGGERMNHSIVISSLARTLLPFVVAGVFDCGSTSAAVADVTCTGNCSCSGNTCTCASSGTCSLGPPGTTIDGSTMEGGASTGVPPNNVTYNCASKNQCTLTCGSGCTSTCDGQSVCVGSCGSNCTSSCAGTSSCTLAAGVNSQVTCAGGSACKVTLDTGSTITCQGDSSCIVDCPKGGCTAECAGAATCTIRCGGTTACSIDCNGMKAQDCAAGSECSGVCPKTGSP